MFRAPGSKLKRLGPAPALGLAVLTVLLASGAAPPDAGWKHLGEAFRLTEVTPISELASHPEKYFNRQVRIEGIVASACTNEGCFIEVVAADLKGEGILVNFPELTHHFPTQCAGARAIVEGMFYQKIYPASRVLHWQGHSFRSGRKVPEFSLIKRIHARAVSITESRGAPLTPGDIVPAPTDRVDLAATEFEADGFGTGRKLLAPGEATDPHSTGKYREIVVCLEGAVTVLRTGGSLTVLHPGEMTYLPPGTQHELKNLTDLPAAYVFVFARAPEPEPKPHEH